MTAVYPNQTEEKLRDCPAAVPEDVSLTSGASPLLDPKSPLGQFRSFMTVTDDKARGFAIRAMTEELYLTMPGAPPLEHAEGSNDNLLPLWGQIVGNAHWVFCEKLATLINRADRSVFK